MKIKSDFITNSSSTCYIVSLPRNFEIETGHIEIDRFLEKILNELNKDGFSEIGYKAEFYDFKIPDDYKEELTDIIYEKIIDNKNFEVFSFEMGADCADIIVNVNSDKIREKIFDKMTLLFQNLEEKTSEAKARLCDK